MQRTVLEILPFLSPPEHLSSMWFFFLQKFLQYLPRSESQQNEGDEAVKANTGVHTPDIKKMIEVPNGTASIPNRLQDSSRNSLSTISTVEGMSLHLFAEKLVPLLVDLFLQAPAAEKYNMFPDIVQSLGRCMTTRRDSPDGALWRSAVEGFNHILVDDISKLPKCGPELTVSRTARIRIWKEVADVYETFLVGYCGRAIPSESLPAASLKADESLEMNILDILGSRILKSQLDAPLDILQRLITTLDRCASRTCSLPVETVELMPFHCSRFSLACLHKLFVLSSYNYEASGWNSTQSEVSKISIMILMMRCEYILKKILTDENDLGERRLPQARVDEIIFVLQELARLVIHPDTASVLPLHPYLKGGFLEENNGKRPHLFVLFPSLCELVISREARVRELVQVLLRLITAELALQKITLAS